MMDGAGMLFSIIVSLVLIGIPAAIILGKAGYSKLWVIVAIIPMVNVIALWVFAFAKWPALRK